MSARTFVTILGNDEERNVHCPDCKSGHIKRVAKIIGHTQPTQDLTRPLYECQVCGTVFDSDGTIANPPAQD